MITSQNYKSARAYTDIECVGETNQVTIGMKLFQHLMLDVPTARSEMDYLQNRLVDLGVYKFKRSKESEAIALFFLHCTFPLLEMVSMFHTEHSVKHSRENFDAQNRPTPQWIVVDLDEDDLYT